MQWRLLHASREIAYATSREALNTAFELAEAKMAAGRWPNYTLTVEFRKRSGELWTKWPPVDRVAKARKASLASRASRKANRKAAWEAAAAAKRLARQAARAQRIEAASAALLARQAARQAERAARAARQLLYRPTRKKKLLPQRRPARFTLDDVEHGSTDMAPAGLADESKSWILRGLYQLQWEEILNRRMSGEYTVNPLWFDMAW